MLILEVDAGDPRPVYRQIVDEVQRSVAVGVLKAGIRFPPCASSPDS